MSILSIGTIQIRHFDAPLGAEVLGLDLRDDISPELFHRLEAEFHKCGVLVFRNQNKLTPEAHISFSRRFGSLEIHVATHCLKPGYPEILIVSNVVDESGRQIGLADAGQYWHSDLSYVAAPSRCSLLHALEVPVGADGAPLGQTLFASAAYAWETLPAETQALLDGRIAVHSYAERYQRQQAAGGRAALSPEQLAQVPPVRHPVARPHPVTGQKVLFVNEGFTTSIDGLPNDVLPGLFAHVTRPEALYEHHWQPGDLVMWDNCLTQHRAVRNYELPLRRLMHRTTVAGGR